MLCKHKDIGDFNLVTKCDTLEMKTTDHKGMWVCLNDPTTLIEGNAQTRKEPAHDNTAAAAYLAMQRPMADYGDYVTPIFDSLCATMSDLYHGTLRSNIVADCVNNLPLTTPVHRDHPNRADAPTAQTSC